MKQMSYSTLNEYLDSAGEEVLNHTSEMTKWGETGCNMRSRIARIRHEDNVTYQAYSVSFSISLSLHVTYIMRQRML